MPPDDLTYATIAELAPRLARRELSPVELTRACLEQIAALDTAVNAFITVLAEQALQEAERAERDIMHGSYKSPLHGIPIAHKDLYSTKHVRTTAGSRIFENVVPEEDATVVEKLKHAGTIMLGKLNMHELAAGGTNDNPYYGACHNPWDLRCIPGGSSGGSAAALAAGMCIAATGSDTAGSIRIPSHYCGTTGLKPTYGRVSAYGVVPLSWSLDHCGPMTRSAEDAALMLNAMAGYDRRDSASVDRRPEDFSSDLNRGVRGLRVGVPTSYFTEPLQDGVERAWRTAIDVLTSEGATRVDVEFKNLNDAIQMGMTIVRAEMATFHARWYAACPRDYSPAMHERFEEAKRLGAMDYVAAQRARDKVRAEFWSAFDRVDVLVVPTVAATATPIGRDEFSLNGQSTELGSIMTRFTYPFNLSGLPSLVVPCGFDEHGLPIGMQIAAAAWQEALVLRVGHAYQQVTDWHRRRPAIAQPASTRR